MEYKTLIGKQNAMLILNIIQYHSILLQQLLPWRVFDFINNDAVLFEQIFILF